MSLVYKSANRTISVLHEHIQACACTQTHSYQHSETEKVFGIICLEPESIVICGKATEEQGTVVGDCYQCQHNQSDHHHPAGETDSASGSHQHSGLDLTLILLIFVTAIIMTTAGAFTRITARVTRATNYSFHC